MKFGLLIHACAAGLLLATLSLSAQAQTSVTYATSGASPRTGTIVAGQAVFTVLPGLDGNINTASDNLLQIDITNTQLAANWSYNRTDCFNTVLFTIAPSVTVNAVNGTTDVTTSLLSGSVVRSANVSSNPVPSQAVNGSWVFGTNIDAEARYKYGVSASAFANINSSNVETPPSATADGKEAYHFTGFSLGTDGDDYSPMPTSVALNGGDDYLNGGNINLVKGTLRLTIADTNVTSASQITGAGFGWASGADGVTGTYAVIEGSSVTVPEPGTLALFGIGLLLSTGLRRRRHDMRTHK
jgi:hypothetical protein